MPPFNSGGAVIPGEIRMLALFDLFTSTCNRIGARLDQRGQGLAEYALILALIAIAAVVALLFLGGVIKNILSTIGASL
jgi:Flp pilus assembly pilin Flp